MNTNFDFFFPAVARIVVGRGSARLVFPLDHARSARHGYAKDIKRFLFPSDGSFHKAKRRGDRALIKAQLGSLS